MPSPATAFKFVVSNPLTPSYSKLTEHAERAGYWRRLFEMWGARHRRGFDGFPGSNPRSISRECLAVLERGRFHVALKSDGVRYALMLTTRPGGAGDAPVALMIDRAANMFEVEVLAPEEYFLKGTILEGEVVIQQPSGEHNLFLIFDCVMSKGVRFTDRPFHERLAEVHRCTRHSEELCTLPSAGDTTTKIADSDSIVMIHFHPRLIMQPKNFVPLEHSARLWEERNDATHRVDGLVLQDIDAPYQSGLCDRCFKWKKIITVDLQSRADGLHCTQGPIATEIYPWNAHVESSRIVCAVGDVLEYAINSVDPNRHVVELFAIRSRPDKMHPNSAQVLRCSIDEYLHSVSIESLVGGAGSRRSPGTPMVCV